MYKQSPIFLLLTWFLVETDTSQILNQSDYLFPGYKTVFHLKKTRKIRLALFDICLTKDQKNYQPNIKIREDLMCPQFPNRNYLKKYPSSLNVDDANPSGHNDQVWHGQIVIFI